MLVKSAIVSFLAATVVADLASVNNALLAIDKNLLGLKQTINSWDGQLFSAIPILFAASSVQNSIKAGAKAANDSQPLSFEDTLVIAQSTVTLADDTTTTIDDLIGIKPKLDKLVIGSPITLSNIKSIRTAVGDLATALIAKIPADTQPIAKELVKGIDDDLARGVKAFGG